MSLPQKFTYLAVSFTFILTASFSQTSVTLQKAEKLFEQEDFYNALPLFEELVYKNEDVTNSNLKAGMCNLFLSRPEEALRQIKIARTPQNEVQPFYQFWLGRAYHLNMKIDSALMCYRKYLVVSSPQDEYRKGVENLIAQVHRTEVHFIGEKSPYDVINLGDNVNTRYTEHSPLVSADGKMLIFTSRRPLQANEIPEADGEYTSKLYFSVMQADGKWNKAQPLFPTLSVKKQFSSVQWLSNEKLLIHSASDGGQLWVADREGNELHEPTIYNTGVPERYFRPDGNFNKSMDKVLFVNNTIFDGTFDLYMLEKKTEAKWNKPWKLPRFLNSDDDEIAPVWMEDGKTIVFSSRSSSGLGGYDLYKTTYDAETKTFTEPVNLEYPINTPGNETHYCEIDKGKKMFISSARANSIGGTDIFMLIPHIEKGF
jgi:tetratricopeptide (TPR) repeat protein